MPNLRLPLGQRMHSRSPARGPGWQHNSLVEIHRGLQSAAHLLREVARVLGAGAAEALAFGVVHVAQVVEGSRLAHLCGAQCYFPPALRGQVAQCLSRAFMAWATRPRGGVLGVHTEPNSGSLGRRASRCALSPLFNDLCVSSLFYGSFFLALT